jgi:hypothetical protein
VRSTSWEIAIPPERMAQTAAQIDLLLADSALPACDASEIAQARRGLEWLELSGGVLRMRLRAGAGRMARPRDVLAALGLDDLERAAFCLTRTRVELEPV